MRKLASIKQINRIVSIPNKDRIELAYVDGWQVIVRKSEFNVGDKCVYIEIDSVLPDIPEFDFLRSKNFVIKTMKMGGVISQGICFPMSILDKYGNHDYKIDEDVTNILGVTQYAKTMDIEVKKDNDKKEFKIVKFLKRFKWFRNLIGIFRDSSKDFPNFISKTDEIRIQNIPNILENKDEKYIATEKIDGQSGTFCLIKRRFYVPFLQKKYEYRVCSRNYRIKKRDNSAFWSVSDKYEIEKSLQKIIQGNEWVTIQGECIAPNVQGNKYNVKSADLYVFNVIFPHGRLDSITAKTMCENVGLKFVPIIEADYTLPDTVEEVLSYAHGKSAIGDNLREGIVFRDKLGQKSFKAVDPLFLLNYNE